MKFEKLYQKLERTFGSMKFAVVVIVLFTIGMIIGTFLESYYGTDFAGRVIYKSTPFMLLQFFMFLSIICAAFIRLPIKKRLYGFYVIHTGLVIIGCGSFITWYAGIDGTISLDPNSPARHVFLQEDVFKIHYQDEGKQVTYKLPYTAFATNINEQYKGITLKEYVPFADRKLSWEKEKNKYKSEIRHSSSYFLYNENVSQDFILSLHPEAQDFEATMSMGLMNIHYLPAPLAKCFPLESKSKLIVWDAKDRQCFTPEQKNIEIQKTDNDVRFFAFKNTAGRVISFFPDMSPWAFDEQIKPMKNAQYRVFSKKLFEDKAHLFLFGTKAAYFDKYLDTPGWVMQEFGSNKSIKLPWMDFTLELVKHDDELVPVYLPEKTLPIQKSNQMIKGDLRALKINVRGTDYWVTSERPLRLLIDGKDTLFTVQKETLRLPFELVLTKFKMDKDPGTNNPASYESFVSLFTKDGPVKSHIYMNNPLKYAGFTFYQASYSQNPETGQYSSTLSVNVDQGRFLKYLGSLLLVLGATWHYMITRRRVKLKNAKALFEAQQA
ncbi:cytochrome c biogenesis protein ResB [Halobacteriovorax sp. GB3]|uniref:cytochrome c biogenesis protein ResB n=1 Tax=Halobacteriovorax sp. GB3 TaxID=2719615 RepID=UPI00235E133B|nr:cytochrome c biogenesis protein ResB [Halobacteriovorax sp. GB3]MDD0852358.1 cytochrome c biogenesis protein ResB [Halobacteriovorax sp. GB3]